MREITATTTRTTDKLGRVEINKKPFGLWWKCDGAGFAASCGPLGDFQAGTLEALAGLVESAERARLAKTEEPRKTKRQKHVPETVPEAEEIRPKKVSKFGLVALALALILRGWPPALAMLVLQGFGPSALLAAGASGLPAPLAIFLLAGGEPEQVALMLPQSTQKYRRDRPRP